MLLRTLAAAGRLPIFVSSCSLQTDSACKECLTVNVVKKTISGAKMMIYISKMRLNTLDRTNVLGLPTDKCLVLQRVAQ